MKRLNRTYRIFIAVLMLFTISSFSIVAAENEHGTLVANHLKKTITHAMNFRKTKYKCC